MTCCMKNFNKYYGKQSNNFKHEDTNFRIITKWSSRYMYIYCESYVCVFHACAILQCISKLIMQGEGTIPDYIT